MVYVSNEEGKMQAEWSPKKTVCVVRQLDRCCQVLDSRTQSPWRLSFLSDIFWGVVEFIGLFFQSLVQPDLSKDGNSSSSSRFSDGRGPPGFPGRRRMGRINHGGGPSPPPMGGGG